MSTNKAEHTPGPWIYQPGDMDGDIFIESENEDRSGVLVAKVENDGPRAKEADGYIPEKMALANAALIASAPELLAALENAIAALNDMRHCAINGQEPGAELITIAGDVDIKASAAIAKAKGDK